MPVIIVFPIAMYARQTLIVQHAQTHFIIISVNAFNLAQLEHVLIIYSKLYLNLFICLVANSTTNACDN